MLLSAFTDRSLNYLCWLQAQSSDRRVHHNLSMASLCHRSEGGSSSSSSREGKNPGPNSRCFHARHFYAKLCMVRNYQHVSGSGLLAKALFPLPTICSIEGPLIVLNSHGMTECSPGSKLSRKKQYHNWKNRGDN